MERGEGKGGELGCLTVEQELVFLHPNENSSFEMDESQ